MFKKFATLTVMLLIASNAMADMPAEMYRQYVAEYPEFRQAEQQMGARYRAISSRLNEEEAAALKRQQFAWLTDRETAVTENEDEDPAHLAKRLAKMSKARYAELVEMDNLLDAEALISSAASTLPATSEQGLPTPQSSTPSITQPSVDERSVTQPQPDADTSKEYPWYMWAVSGTGFALILGLILRAFTSVRSSMRRHAVRQALSNTASHVGFDIVRKARERLAKQKAKQAHQQLEIEKAAAKKILAQALRK